VIVWRATAVHGVGRKDHELPDRRVRCLCIVPQACFHRSQTGNRRRKMRSVVSLLLIGLCVGCSGGQYATHLDGRRGYDGSGDYGYDVAASSAEARSYRARAAHSYTVPGETDDPWKLYIREAAYRFRVPELWIRAVMRQESGGRLYDDDGALITSSAGAM